ncbi:Exonuclease 3'-5' domain-containing protein 2 [Desmophyllum pertusum]|uniref:Exonuclease 3'-5' domain-containing protein 2 n=1 Tax=Desmophyllum pertusum TaxID=174260 RepID=A0A9W9YWM4_9CNID|nr:Exonuclease 3'-5' domain-containing protein 2 [Desmophyllum pertusum]
MVVGILFLGPAQQVWRTFDHNFISSRNGCGRSKTSRVFVIDNVSSCNKLLQSYRSQYPLQLNFLGMDCEWVNKKGQTNAPVALLQIATPLSDCFLIRLCKMDGHLPQSVREILEDKNILKFGVGIKDDAKRLSGMFGIDVLGCVDLRHVIQRCRVENGVQSRNQKMSLDALAKRILGVTMDKYWRVRCSNWEAEQFDRRQIEYAMNDALVASHIFLRLVKLKTEERKMLKTACISEDSICVEKEVSGYSKVDSNLPDSTKNLLGDDITSGSEIHDLISIEEEPNLAHPSEDSICVEKEASIYSESWLSQCKVDGNLPDSTKNLSGDDITSGVEIHDSISTEEEPGNLAHPSEIINSMESDVIDSNLPDSTKNLSGDDTTNGCEIDDLISIEEEANLTRPSKTINCIISDVIEDQQKCKENSSQEDLSNVTMVNIKQDSSSGTEGNDSRICQNIFQNSEDFSHGFAFNLDFDVYNVTADLNKLESGHDEDKGYLVREEVIDLLQDSFYCQRASSLCHGVVDFAFKDKKRAVKAKEKDKKKGDTVETSDRKPYKGTIRKSPLYMNCMLAAPDGSRLCTLDRKKADWYIDKGIGHLTCLEPYTVQLKFEPSGRPGSEDSYYLNFKDNVCVVCGSDQSYMRKNIVPHDYRRYFPFVMKDHHSHDILLMCPECHRLSNFCDDKLRKELANKYNAPLGNAAMARLIENPDLKKVKSAAKALNYAGDKLPQDRHQQLSLIVQKYFNASILTPEMITEAATMETRKENSDFVSHGQEVVKKLREEGKLLEFEKIWRQHFLDTMRPQYLPPLWSVDHRHDGLKEKLDDFNES